jgi:HD-like signal output (HDOD) protein
MPNIRERIIESGNLPTLPAAAMYILQLANDDSTDMPKLAATIEKDPALSLKVLRAVNSPFYGIPQKVSTVSQAVVLLGLHAVKALVLGFTLLNSVKSRKGGFDHLAFWRRSMYAAAASRIIGGKTVMARQEDCFVAALLMDIGTLLLAQLLGSQYDDLCERAGCHADLMVHENHELGIHHAEVAELLADHWKLPDVLAVPMGQHHGPPAVQDTGLRRITEVIWLGGRCADIFISNHSAADSISAVRTSCKNMYGMDELTADAMLCSVGQKTSELAALFDVRLNSAANYEQILASASQRLLELSLAEQNKGEAANKRRAARMRRDGKILVTPCARGILGSPLQVRLRDLSATGIGLTHANPFEPGSQFVIRLPDPAGGQKTLLYTVRRCDKVGLLNSVGAELTSVLRPEEANANAAA